MRRQKGKAFAILPEQEMMGWQWHQLDHMQIICTSLQTRDVNIEFFPNPDIECDNPVKIRISDFIRAA